METLISKKEKYINLKLKVASLKNIYALEIEADRNDDIIGLDELHLIKDVAYEFSLRSKDVIHAAYYPHFRLQMNVVPGMPTKLFYTPTVLSENQRLKLNKPEFNFILMCNKICGRFHSKMTNPVIVESENEFVKWIEKNN